MFEELKDFFMQIWIALLKSILFSLIWARGVSFFHPDYPPVGFDSKLKSSVEKHNIVIVFQMRKYNNYSY